MTTLLALTRSLAKATAKLSFGPPVAHVYRPLDYAWDIAARYVETYGQGRKEVVVLGMNPGPFGMTQTGVPFGDVTMVRDWLKLEGAVGQPHHPHPKRPVLGFASSRGEVSGQRLWGAFAQKYPRAEDFFARAYVLNYCPLLFLDEGARNVTPDKLAPAERKAVELVCDEHLRKMLAVLDPRHTIGIGLYAAKRLAVVTGKEARAIPHPSPASPAANRGWQAAARKALESAGVIDLL
jgi:single-strand selective monofunctional uracil DNA glycosylase